ncbi:uncharacterized protein J4E88_007625 [Alternaria novae-zelandiae]|uniref:uncharacterized protein n=1 Tax=Alternaria novae-zelandiae TaxID=430562 RepID=UPI0020C3BF3F|nr:uncharacterized protein J4E88_007625 [Alternaria novae-zelandiae]KAI4675592.1 hypothetical protein J4E88_007625 [Alternaria novae-zelandiae]
MELIKYYLQERLPTLYIRRQFVYDEKEFHDRTYDPTGLIRDLWEAYEELEYVHTRFLHWIKCDNHPEQYIYDRMYEDHREWKTVSTYLRSVWEASKVHRLTYRISVKLLDICIVVLTLW